MAPTRSTDLVHVDLRRGAFDALRAVNYGRDFAPHFHDSFAIAVHEAGSARVRTSRGEWLAESGTVVALSPGEVHSVEPVSGAGFSYRIIYPDAEFLNAVGIATVPAVRGTPLFATPVTNDAGLAYQLRNAYALIMEGNDRDRGEAKLATALRDVARRLGGPSSVAPAPVDEVRIAERAMAYLKVHLAESVSLARLARVSGVNAYQLTRAFSRCVGMPPYAYVVQLRVNRARELLRSGCTIAAVARAAGFVDDRHLARIFEELVGVGPEAFQGSSRLRKSSYRSQGLSQARAVPYTRSPSGSHHVDQQLPSPVRRDRGAPR